MCTERIFDLKLQLKPGARYDANVLNGTVGKLFGQIWHIPKAGLGPSVCAIFSERIALGSHQKKKETNGWYLQEWPPAVKLG